jgi:hypothetical protein
MSTADRRTPNAERRMPNAGSWRGKRRAGKRRQACVELPDAELMAGGRWAWGREEVTGAEGDEGS